MENEDPQVVAKEQFEEMRRRHEHMNIRKAALTLARLVAWDHTEYSDGGELNPHCEICQSIRYVKQHPPAVYVNMVSSERHVDEDDDRNYIPLDAVRNVRNVQREVPASRPAIQEQDGAAVGIAESQSMSRSERMKESWRKRRAKK